MNRGQEPLGLAIDLGSTTVAALLTGLDGGQVYAGAASLNQQSVYGADVISRIFAALNSPADAERLQLLPGSDEKIARTDEAIVTGRLRELDRDEA